MRSRWPLLLLILPAALCLLCSLCGRVASAAAIDGGTIYPDFSNAGFFDGVSTLLDTLTPAFVLVLGFALGALILVKARDMF